jgi:predicted DNA-binding transcriptional regulator YafY
MLEAFVPPFVRAATRIESEADAKGWRIAIMPVGSVRQASVDLLRLGAEVEVLEPAELRTKMAEIAAGMSMMYASRK